MKRSAAISFLGMREAKKVDSFSLKLLNRPLSSPLDSPNEEPGIALTKLLVLVLVLLLHSLLVLFGLGFVLIKLMLGPLVLLIPMMRNGGAGVNLGSLINNGFCIFFFFLSEKGCFGNLGVGLGEWRGGEWCGGVVLRDRWWSVRESVGLVGYGLGGVLSFCVKLLCPCMVTNYDICIPKWHCPGVGPS